MFKKGYSFLIVSAMILLVHSVAYGAVTVTAAAPTDPELLGIVQKVVDGFNEIIQEKYNLTLTADVQLIVCPNVDSYTRILQEKFKMGKAVAERRARLTGGMAGYRDRIIAINLDPDDNYDPEYHAYYSTAHELVHQLQFQLAGEKISEKLYWMVEGTANYIAAQVVESLGFATVTTWKTGEFFTVRYAENYVSPHSIKYISTSAWERYVEEKRYPYQVADLIVLYLVGRSPSDREQGLIRYFQGSEEVRQDSVWFETAFGVSLDSFMRNVERWLSDNLMLLGKLEFKSQGNHEEWVAINEGFYRSQVFFQQNFNTYLKARQEFILCPERFTYMNALKKEARIKNQAELMQLVKNNPWWINKNETWFNLGAMGDCSRQIFYTAQMMADRLQRELIQVASYENAVWIRYGINTLLAAYIAEQAEVGTVEGYRREWLQNVNRQATPISLKDLQTQEGWDRAVTKYGPEAVHGLAGLAIDQLLGNKGLAALKLWLGKQELRNSFKESVAQCFGVQLDDFIRTFEVKKERPEA